MDVNDRPNLSSTRGAMTIGALTAGVMLLVGALNAQIIGWIVFVLGIFLGIRTWRIVKGWNITYFQAVGVGFKTAFFASLILAFFAYVSTTMDGTLIPALIDSAEEQMLNSGVSEGMVEIAIQSWREMLSPMVFGGIIIVMYSSTGGLISLLLAYIFSGLKPPENV